MVVADGVIDSLPGVSPWALGVVALVVLGLAWIAGRALVDTSHSRPGSLLVVALVMVTVAAIFGVVLTNSPVLGGVAATGVGALASTAAYRLAVARQKPDDGVTLRETEPDKGDES